MPAILKKSFQRSRHSQEDLLFLQCQTEGISEPIRQYRFHPERKWRFDFALPSEMIAIEVEGGVFINGGHSRGSAHERDCEKFAEAAILGWTVLRVTSRHVKDGRAIHWIKRLMKK